MSRTLLSQTLAPRDVGDRDREEGQRDDHEHEIEHVPLPPVPLDQNFTRIANVTRFSVLRRSSAHPGMSALGLPVFPPGGVTPPGPEK